MNILVIGCGKIGTSVISSLVAEGHDVVAIDKDPDIISEITNIYDCHRRLRQRSRLQNPS